MGKYIIFMVSAVILGASMLIYEGQRSTFEAREHQSDYQFQGIASGAAKSGFERGVSAIKRTLLDDSQAFPRVTLDDGYYDLAISRNLYGDLDLDVQAVSGGAHYDIQGNVLFNAPLQAAVSLEDENVDVSWSGAYQVSGVDRRMPSRGTGGGLLEPVPALITTYSKRGAATSTVQTNRLLGLGGSPDDPVDLSSAVGGFDEAALETLYQEARLAATDVLTPTLGGLVPEGDLVSALAGSSAGVPKIIRVLGDLTITGNVSGHGLLLVEDGDLTVTAPQFDWEGLILVRKQMKDTVSVSLRNTTVYGGVAAYDFDGATALPECVPDFDVVGDEAVVNEPFTVRFKVLGAAITYGGTYDVPVTLRVHMGSDVYEPFGDYNLALDGNVNTGNSGVTYAWEPATVFPAGTAIRVDAKSWVKKSSSYDGTQNSHWQVYMEMNSTASSQQLELLEKGSSVPSVGGFMGQYSVETFLADYVEDDKMKLTPNQAVNLFELGSTSTSSEAFDMQDAVVLVTMVKAGEAGCVGGASSSRLEFSVQDNTKIHYSSEAIAKLGQYLSTVRSATSVGVVRSVVEGRGKDETPVYVETLAVDDHEDDDPSGTSGNTGSTEISVCHKPQKNGGDSKTIKKKSLGKHIAHGDYVGTCTGWNPNN